MKVTTNTIISDIRNLATGGSNPIDFRIEDSQLLYWVDQSRATLIAQDIQKRKDVSTLWIQSITCLDLIEVDKSECCEVETDCKILRTEVKLPRTVEGLGENSIIRVTSNSGDLISKISVFESKYDKYSKYTSNKPKWFEKNDYIYILNNEFLSHINVDAVWDSPSELSQYTSCGNTPCFNIDDAYPCSLKMASTITDIVFKTKVVPFLQLPQDNLNDSSNNPTINQQVKQ